MRVYLYPIFIFFLIMYVPFLGFSEPRTVQLEWEPDTEAISYQVEIGKKNKDISFQTFSDILAPRFLGLLDPGFYWMRVRGKDDRSIYGLWGEKTFFTVKAAAPILLQPQNYYTLNSLNKSERILLKWKPIKGASSYLAVVITEKGESVLNQNTNSTEWKINLVSAQKYKWYVQAIDEDGNLGELPTDLNEFTILGPALDKLVINKPVNKFVREIKVEKREGFYEIKFNFLKYNIMRRSWEEQGEIVTADSKVKFPLDWSGGRYQVIVQPFSKYRNMTQATLIEFEVIDGDRSFLAESIALIRESIERNNGLFLSSSLEIAPVNYHSSVISQNQNVDFKALTQHYSIGIGYLKPQQPWGVFLNTEYSLINFDSGEKLFLNYEIQTIYRTNISKSHDIQMRLGYFSNQIPELNYSQNHTSVNSSNFQGLSLGFEYWISISPKWAYAGTAYYKKGFNGQSYSGYHVTDSSITMLGFQNAYRYNSNLSLLFGYGYRNTNLSFSDENSKLGIVDSSLINYSGHYLNLTFEYNFSDGGR